MVAAVVVVAVSAVEEEEVVDLEAEAGRLAVEPFFSHSFWIPSNTFVL